MAKCIQCGSERSIDVHGQKVCALCGWVISGKKKLSGDEITCDQCKRKTPMNNYCIHCGHPIVERR